MLKKTFLAVVFITAVLFGRVHATVLDSLTNEISDAVFGPVANVISQELARHMGFYTGSGNMTWATPSQFLGLKTGLGLGINMSEVFRQAAFKKDYSAFNQAGTNQNATLANKLSAVVAIFPFPYDMLYAKMGLPELPLDVGLRIGVIPIPTVTTADGVSYYANAFHIGAEGRYLIQKYFGDYITINGCVSLDYNGGGMGISYSNISQAFTNNVLVGTNYAAMGMNIGWGGVSLGGKVLAMLNIPVIGGAYTGLGLNVNLGVVNTELFMLGSFRDLTASSFTLNFGKTVPWGYNFLDLRFLFGFQLLFVSMSLEYGILNKDLALNFYPIALSF